MSKEDEKFSERYFQKDNICILQKGIFQKSTEKRIDMLKYGIMAKAVEMMCFNSSLERLSEIYPDMDMKAYKKKAKKEYKAMLLRTPDIGGSSLEANLYIAAFVFSLHKAEP